MKNKIMLITYADSMGKNLSALHRILNRYFQEAVGGVHVLPFFPSSADRGFAPMRYDIVDPKFGTFADIMSLGKDYYLMFDFMVNHISRSSQYFQDFLRQKDASPYKDYFIRYKDFWPNGEPTQEQVDAIYKRKPRAPYLDAQFADGTKEKVWCTFGDEQIDLDVTKPATMEFIQKTLVDMCQHGASLIRLDAFAYAVKKPGGSCFFEEPEIWDLLHKIQNIVHPYGVDILPEIHEHYTIQMKIARQGFWIYDFALPVLLLYAIYTHEVKYLKNWLEMSPKKQFTTLDTHDGIGIVDVRDLLPDDQIALTKEMMFTKGANVKKIYNTAAYNNLDIYQVNTTYYSALGNQDDAYLLARAVQFFAPGIPQVYYVGLLAGKNDIALMEQTKNGRDINRHSYTEEEIDREVQRPVVQRLLELMKFRNTHPAFAVEGDLHVEMPKSDVLVLRRTAGADWAELTADFTKRQFKITCS
ncbi:MAG TPA: sucrose phosphorylase [Ruminococcaceae bacterium]|jgi:sucrose phosphorylase|nr:sucrose phosphorylase [Oscillospiraceae bacterium]